MLAQVVSMRFCCSVRLILRTGVKSSFNTVNVSANCSISTKKIIRFVPPPIRSSGFTDRVAAMADKDAILAINENVYGGKDYLEDYFDYFMDSPHILSVVGEMNGTIVAFLSFTLIDNGQAIVERGLRVTPDYQGQGFTRHLFDAARRLCQSTDAVRLAYLASKFSVPGVKLFKLNAHSYIMDISQGDFRDGIQDIISKSRSNEEKKIMEESDMLKLLTNQQHMSYLFPRKRMTVDYVPYRLQQENVPLILGRNTVLLSDVISDRDSTRGLLSACTLYRSKSPAYSAAIEVFGSTLDSLSGHLATHFLRVGLVAQEAVYIEIVTDNSVPNDSFEKEIAEFQAVGLRHVDTRGDYVIKMER